MTKLSFLALLSIGILSAQSHGVEGTVLDPSGRSVQGARVKCAGQEAQTGPEGQFRFPGVNRCDAEVAADGFAPLKQSVEAGAPVRLSLAIRGVAEQVVVTATRRETTLDDAGVAGNVITRADLQQAQSPMLLDVLRDLPGAMVVQSGRMGAEASLFTRGSSSTGTLVLLDGMPINDPGGALNFGQLETNGLDRIEIVRGPESPLFGAEAASGVIQMFTQQGDPEAKTPHGSVSDERGSFQTDLWTANLSGGSGEKFDYALSAQQTHTVGEFQNDAYRNTGGSVDLGYRLSRNTDIRGVFRSYDSWLGAPGQVAYGLFDTGAFETTRDNTVSVRLDDVRSSTFTQQVSFGYHHDYDVYTDASGGGPYSFAMLVHDVYSPIHRVYRAGFLDPNNLPAASQLAPGYRIIDVENDYLYPLDAPYVSDSERERFNYQGTWNHSSGGSLVFGYDYERQAGVISGYDVTRNNQGLFLSEQYTIGGRIVLTAGARGERSSAFGTIFTPRAAASVRVSGEHGVLSSTIFRASAARGVTEPSLLDNYARDAYDVGNPNLRPEKTASYDTGLVQEWFSRRLRTEVSAFRNSFTDLITFVPLPPPVWGTWQNIEASWARGLEFSARARVAKYITLNGEYTRMWTRITQSETPNDLVYGIGQELLRRPGNSAALSVSIAPRRWFFETGVVLVGERQDSDYFGVTRNPGYQNVHASGSYHINKHVAPFLSADNILNMRYEEALGYTALSRSIRGGCRLEW